MQLRGQIKKKITKDQGKNTESRNMGMTEEPVRKIYIFQMLTVSDSKQASNFLEI